MSLEANAERFEGFTDLYDLMRPAPPDEAVEVIAAYAGGMPRQVVDLGSGTGLSSRWIAAWAAEVIGVEPGEGMRAQATAIGGPRNLRYVSGWSHETGLPSASADAVLAVQALHWMDPAGTYAEVARVLRSGGVFAALDCDWPPVVGDAALEAAWTRCRSLARSYEERYAAGLTGEALSGSLAAEVPVTPPAFGRDGHRQRLPGGVASWSKDDHLDRMSASGAFRWTREMAFHKAEPGDAARFTGLLLSQGDVQAALRHGATPAALGVEDLERAATRSWGSAGRRFWFTYRMRLGVR